MPDAEQVHAAIHAALAEVADPCMAMAGLDLSVVDMGLICEVRLGGVEGGTEVEIDLTFTELGCSFSHHLASRVQDAVLALDGVVDVRINPVWSPAWSRDRLSPRARRELGAARGRLSELPRARLPTR